VKQEKDLFDLLPWKRNPPERKKAWQKKGPEGNPVEGKENLIVK